MKNIKLIIDFPESEWDYIKNDDDAGLHLLTRAIANAKPLQEEFEEVKTEMMQVQTHRIWGTIYSVPKEPQEIRAECLQILDNHIKKLEEK